MGAEQRAEVLSAKVRELEARAEMAEANLRTLLASVRGREAQRDAPVGDSEMEAILGVLKGGDEGDGEVAHPRRGVRRLAGRRAESKRRAGARGLAHLGRPARGSVVRVRALRSSGPRPCTSPGCRAPPRGRWRPPGSADGTGIPSGSSSGPAPRPPGSAGRCRPPPAPRRAAPCVYGCRGRRSTSSVGPSSTSAAQVHDGDAVGDRPGQPQVVGHDDDRQAEVLAELHQQLEDLAAHRRVQVRHRLVGDDDLRVRARGRRRSPRADADRPRARAGTTGRSAPGAAAPTRESARPTSCSSVSPFGPAWIPWIRRPSAMIS